MKKLFGILMVLALAMSVSFTSCNKDETITKDDGFKDTEVALTSLEPDVVVRGTANKDDYEKVIVEDVVRSKECKGEPVSGIIEFYYDGEMVFAVDFGDGSCDGAATVSYLDDENTLQSKVVDVWKLFKKQNEGNQRPKCFEFVFPVSYTMPDGTTLTIESEDDWSLLREWCQANAEYEEKPALNFPVDIMFEDQTTITINTGEELKEARKDCSEGHSRKCFELVLPVSMEMPDGTSLTIETEEDWSLVREWHINNPEYDEKGSLVFPVDIIYEDGTTVTISSEEEMQEAKRDCKEGGLGAKCFEFTLPVSFTMPDASIITISTEDDWALLKLWYVDNPGVEEKPALIFPVEITFTEDGTTLTVNSIEEMRAIREDCHPNGHGHGQGHAN